MQKKIFFTLLVCFFGGYLMFFVDVFNIQNPYFRDILAGTDEMLFVYKNTENPKKIDSTKLKNKRLINDFLREIDDEFLKIEKNISPKNYQSNQDFYKNPSLFAKIIFSRKKFKLHLCEVLVLKEKTDFKLIFLQKNKNQLSYFTQNLSQKQLHILETARVFSDFIENL